MVSDIRQFFIDYNIAYASEGHKHCRPGWLNMPCPFCTGNPGHHLGFTENGKICYCWRCGWHPVPLVISKLLSIPEKEAKTLLLQYVGFVGKTAAEPKVRIKAHKLPTGTEELQKQHNRYLEKRNFDPSYIAKEWGVLGTGPIATLDGINYSHRILAPIHWEGKQVSFQTRDITNKHPMKYLACPQKREIMQHKHIIYGNQCKWNADVGICVEGITDVWRLGSSAFATFGIEYSHQQVRLIAKLFRRVFVIFDSEPQAAKQAKALRGDLNFRGTESILINISDDPASLDQKEADYLVNHLIGNDL